MSSLWTTARDNLWYSRGFFEGRWYALPSSFTGWYAFTISKLARLISLPLPFLSFLALPFFGGTSTSLSLVFFYLTWSALVFSHSPLDIEVWGTFAVRLVFYQLPALAFLVFDYAFPDAANSIKTYGAQANPRRLGRDKLTNVLIVSTANLVLATVLQAALEFLFTQVLHMRSLLRVSSFIPLPLSIIQDFARGLAVRGLLHYLAHRFLLHTYQTPLRTWHAQWQHSIRLPFSLVATYDHPACYIVGQWLPTILPAYLFRFHVLTWQLFVMLVSLEQLFIYSGYSVLPSRIILGGMARRMDAHFATFRAGRLATNFGNLGVLDLLFRTSGSDTFDLLDDVQREASKHRVKERTAALVEGAQAGLQEEERRNKPLKDTSTSDEAGLENGEGTVTGLRRKLTRRRRQ